MVKPIVQVERAVKKAPVKLKQYLKGFHFAEDHEWKPSQKLIPLVGNLYGRIYPYACKCGAVRDSRGKVYPPAISLLISMPSPATESRTPWGKRIKCEESGKIILEQEDIRQFQFVDYSWLCPGCKLVHCSQCWYESDGETITVKDCGAGESLAEAAKEIGSYG